ncbi:MAG: Xylose isomerase domain protein barrel [Herbaspirillum sp.]|nr:Xylose isomerase domain protein barrel [Herbaspirillum sp.]
MRLSISNIAWDPAEDEAIVGLLHEFDVDAIDIAPGKYFPDPAKTTVDEINRIKNWWSERGIEIVGMQSLLFGTTGLNVFGTPESQDAMLHHLDAVCRIGSGLGAKRLVFGSPKNRDRTGLSDQAAMDVAVPFFLRLGEIAEKQGVMICLEPNPAYYGSNFMIDSTETAQMVRTVGHPAIRMQLDTGSLSMNGEDALAILEKISPLIGHVHASEPYLRPLGDDNTDHHQIALTLHRYLPDHIVTIEMLATKDESHQISIKRALNTAVSDYRNPRSGVVVG